MYFLRQTLTALAVVLFATVVFTLPVLAGDEPLWRPVDPADLALKEPRVEKDADAEAIFWEVRLDDKKAGKLAYEHYVRVKIFTERGREKFSKFDIPFLKGKKVEDVAARVIKPDGSIIQLNPADVFEREIARGDGIKFKAKSFAISGIEPGVILEYRYKETFKNDSADGERLLFQRDIPIQRISYYIRPYEGMPLQTERFNMPGDFGFSKDKDGFSVATLTNVPAFREEPFMPPDSEVRSWALIYYSNYFSNRRWASFANNISTAIKELFKPNDDVRKTALEITAGVSTNEEKVQKLYEFVQTQIKNITFDNTLTPEQKENIKNKSAAETLKRRMGTAQHIEVLFASLATALGLESRLVLAGDRSEFFVDLNKNDHSSFIHIACIAVKIGEKWKLYNPGTPFLSAGKLLWYEEDVPIILVGDGHYLTSRSPLSDIDKTVTKRSGKFKLLDDGTLEGTIKIEYTGHYAISRYSNFYNDSEQKRQEDFKGQIKENLNAADVSDIVIENFKDSSKPLIYSAKVRVPNYAQKTGKRMFLQPGFFEYGSKSVFSSATRKHPIFFRYPWAENDEIEIELPANFTLENAEAPGIVKETNSIGVDNINILLTTDKKKLVYKRSFHFGKGGNILFPVESYPALKTLFDAFQKADTHSLVLKQETTPPSK